MKTISKNNRNFIMFFFKIAITQEYYLKEKLFFDKFFYEFQS